MNTISIIRDFITRIYNFFMYLLDCVEAAAAVELRFDHTTKVIEKDAVFSAPLLPQDISGDEASSAIYHPLYFDNLTYSDFANYGGIGRSESSYWGGNENYMNDLFYATRNDDTLDINRVFLSLNVDTKVGNSGGSGEIGVRRTLISPEKNIGIDLDARLEEIIDFASEDYDDMPELVSISSDSGEGGGATSITPLECPLDEKDDFTPLSADEIAMLDRDRDDFIDKTMLEYDMREYGE